jgi:MFS family permease
VRSRADQTNQWLPLAVLATAQFLVVLSTSIVNVALPQIRTGLGLSTAGLSWVVNAYVLVFGALLLLGGRTGDVYGLRRVFIVGTGLFAVSSLTAALANGAVMLIAARTVLAGGLVLLAGGLAWLSATPADGTFLSILLGPSLLAGAGLGVAFVQLTALSSSGVPAADSGLAGGLINATRQIGGAIGLALLTFLGGYGAAFLACAVLVLLTGLLSTVIIRN